MQGMLALMVMVALGARVWAEEACCKMPAAGEAAGSTNWVAQSKCPVDGKPLSADLYAEAGGARIYACSTECLEKIKAGAGAYLESMIQSGEQPLWVGPAEGGKAQQTCPVMGGKADAKVRVKVAGTCVNVCCQVCVAEVKAHPGKYIRKVVDGGESLGAGCGSCAACPK